MVSLELVVESVSDRGGADRQAGRSEPLSSDQDVRKLGPVVALLYPGDRLRSHGRSQ